MKILITGGSGFIGTNLVEFYLQQGFTVLNLDLVPPRNPKHHLFWQKIDITLLDDTLSTVKAFDPDYCFHLAARTDLNGSNIQDYLPNTLGVRNIIDALTLCKSLKLTVFASSMLVCNIGYSPVDDFDYCPSTPYGESKVEGERLVRDLATGRIPWVVVRPTSIWGPWFAMPYKDFFISIRKGFYAHPRGVRVWRSYGFVYNTIYQLNQLLLQNGGNLIGKVVYLADYKPLELYEWGTLIQKQFNVKKIPQLPIIFFLMGALCGDILKFFGVRFPLTSFRLRNMLTDTVHDTSALSDLTGDLPFNTAVGVRITCEWMVSYD